MHIPLGENKPKRKTTDMLEAFQDELYSTVVVWPTIQSHELYSTVVVWPTIQSHEGLNKAQIKHQLKGRCGYGSPVCGNCCTVNTCKVEYDVCEHLTVHHLFFKTKRLVFSTKLRIRYSKEGACFPAHVSVLYQTWNAGGFRKSSVAASTPVLYFWKETKQMAGTASIS